MYSSTFRFLRSVRLALRPARYTFKTRSEKFAALFTDKLVPPVLSRFSEQADARVAAAKNRVVLNVARSLLLMRISKVRQFFIRHFAQCR